MYPNKIKLNLTILLLVFSSLFGFLFDTGIFGNGRSIFNLVLDIILIIVGITSLKNCKSLLMIFVLFLAFSLITYFINSNELPFTLYSNGLREFIPYFIFPIIYINLFDSYWNQILIKKFNLFLYIFLGLQIPVSIYQFLVFGAGDKVGGTLGNGNSGVLSFIIFLSTYYLMTQDFDSNNTFRSFIKKSYLLIFWLPTFINETKISFILIVIFFLLLTSFSIINIWKYVLIGVVTVPILFMFDSIYKTTTGNSYIDDILNEDYLERYLNSDNEGFTDIPRGRKIILFFETFNTEDILIGKGLGQFKGGTTLELTAFASKYQWLLTGSIPMFFFILVQSGLLGLVLFLSYWVKLLKNRNKTNPVNYHINLILYISFCFLIIQAYNDSLRNLFFCGIIMYLLTYATSNKQYAKEE